MLVKAKNIAKMFEVKDHRRDIEKTDANDRNNNQSNRKVRLQREKDRESKKRK